MDSSPKFFNPYEVILRHGVRLPHWQQLGASYFLTFRLADSIPQSQLMVWKEERDDWIAHHPEPWSQEAEAEYHRLFSASIDRHLDAGAGSCLLRNKAAARVFAETLQSGNGTRFGLHSFVVMPNHVHLATTLNGGESLPKLVKLWKGVSARRIGEITSTDGKLW